MKLTIPGELPDLNTEIKVTKSHWGGYSSHKKRWTNYVAVYAKQSKIIITKFPIKPKLTFFTKNLKKDSDNIEFAKKYIYDGLVQGGVIPNDSRRFISGSDCECLVDRDNPRVEIEIN